MSLFQFLFFTFKAFITFQTTSGVIIILRLIKGKGLIKQKVIKQMYRQFVHLTIICMYDIALIISIYQKISIICIYEAHDLLYCVVNYIE